MAALLIAILLVITALTVVLFVTNRSTDTKQKTQKTVPGLDKTDAELGNLPDIADARSLHQFLVKLHNEFGPIAAFWFGKQQCVSVADADFFKAMRNSFDRPSLLFDLFRPLITEHSIQYANGKTGKDRRNATDKFFGADMMNLFCQHFNGVGGETIDKLEKSMLLGEHIPLWETTLTMVIKGLARTSFGDYFKNDKMCLEFKNAYETCWGDMELRLDGIQPEESSDRQTAFEKAQSKMMNVISDIIAQRRQFPPRPDEFSFVDQLLQHTDLYPQNVLLADSLSYMIGGFHTSGNLLAWTIYFLCLNDAVAEKAFEEVTRVVGLEDDVSPDQVKDLRYLRQVIDEAMRLSVLAPFAARVHDDDIILGDYVIKAKTPIVHALGVTLQDPKLWPAPDKFDPDRFNPEKEKARHTYGYVPFGIGKRMCPGYRFVYCEVVVFLAILLRRFRFQLIPGQVVEKKYGLVTSPAQEVWVSLQRRDP